MISQTQADMLNANLANKYGLCMSPPEDMLLIGMASIASPSLKKMDTLVKLTSASKLIALNTKASQKHHRSSSNQTWQWEMTCYIKGGFIGKKTTVSVKLSELSTALLDCLMVCPLSERLCSKGNESRTCRANPSMFPC